MAERCVVVGAGGISNAWFPPLKMEQVEIAAVVDLRREAAAGQIAKYQLQAEPMVDLAAALAKYQPQFVVDLTIPEAHHAVTCQALRAGCHVIGEKPMAATMAEARETIRCAEEAGRLFMVSQSRRWSARHAQVHEAVTRKLIGELTTVNCDFYIGAHFGGFREEMASPLILDMAIHHFDLARYMTGLDPVAVYALEFNPKGSWYRGDVSASCLFEMTDNEVFSYRGSWCAEGCPTSWNGDWRLIGDRGTLLYHHDEEPQGEVVSGENGFHRPVAPLAVPSAEMPSTGMHGALREMLRYLREGVIPQTECHDNIKSLAMVFAVIESARRHQRVEIAELL
ncbi:MAG: Gfo/Idh/MocA family oxidoreductase [Armatimonadetes bacterium]|nr:Gfo/Idh/MocA family oxidoreductase [Armatimonadota bacterium]